MNLRTSTAFVIGYPEALRHPKNLKDSSFALSLLLVFLVATITSSPNAMVHLHEPTYLVDHDPIGILSIGAGALIVASFIGRRKGLYKIPVKLATLLLCFYGSALAVTSYMEGFPALVPYFLITLALLLVIFW